MRTVFLLLASSMALALAACDRGANNNRGPAPTGYGGGPTSESQSSDDEGTKAAPVGSAADELPDAGAALNDAAAKRPLPTQQKKLDTIPNTSDPTTKY